MPESRTIGRVELIDAITPHAEPASACIRYQRADGKYALGWIYDPDQVRDAIEAFKRNDLHLRVFMTVNKKGSPYSIRDGTHVGLVLHRDDLVRVFAFDLDDHGNGSNTHAVRSIATLLGADPIVFTSRRGAGLHLFFRLTEPVKVDRFVDWAKSWGFNRKGSIEVFPKTEKETQIAMPGEPNADGGDTWVSGDLATWEVRSLPQPPPFNASTETLLYLAGVTPHGSRNDELNRAAFDLGKRGIDRASAWKWCKAACERNGLWKENREECERTFDSGYGDGSGVANERASAIFGGPGPEIGQRDPDTGQFVFDPNRTQLIADAYLTDRHQHPEHQTLIHYAGEFYEWAGSHWRMVNEAQMTARVFPWLNDSLRPVTRKGGDVALVPFPANPTTVSAAVKTIAARSYLSETIEVGGYIRKRAGDIRQDRLLAHAGGLLDLETRQAVEGTPRLFNTFALPFEYDPDAPTPERWLDFLKEVFTMRTDANGEPGEVVDDCAITLIQQWFGYCLTPDTSQQKIMLLYGPRRSGKGTIAKVLTALIGDQNKAGPTVEHLAHPFGLADLIGKSVAIVADARFRGQHMTTVAERLLCISGEDQVTVSRKYLSGVTLKLPTRFMFLSNELPKLADSSTALASRFIPVKIEKTFYGQEDTRLVDSLLEELPGILLWAIRGWEMLQRAGKFAVESKQLEAVEEMEDLSSPVGAFVRDECKPGWGRRVDVATLYHRFVQWCQENGVEYVPNRSMFGRDLMAVMPTVSKKRSHDGGYFYDGLSIS